MVKILLKTICSRAPPTRALKIYRMTSSLSKTHKHCYDKYLSGQGIERKDGLKIHKTTKLADIFEVEKARNLEATTIASIWASHFDKVPLSFGLSVPDTVYAKWIGERARQSPIFIIPLNIGPGICNIVVQHQITPFGGAAIAFTPLDEYQKYQESAPVRVLSFLFDDYVHDKQICLIQTRFDGSLFTRERAMELLKNCIDLYSIDASYQFIQQFNHFPHAFDYAIFVSFYQARFPPRLQ